MLSTTSIIQIKPSRAENTITVPDDYSTIQAAINAANDGDTIYVRANTYYENVVVNKSLSLIGADRFSAIIDGNHTGNVMTVMASNVKITGFTIRNSGLFPNHGIYAESITGGNISFNIFRDNFRAIWFSRSANNTISKNNIISNVLGIVLADGSSSNNITDNTISNASGHGIGLDYSSENTVYRNRVRNTASSVLIDHSAYNNIMGNDLSENKIGVHLVFSHNNNVSRNSVKNNERGFYIWGSPNNIIYHNNIINNTRTQAEIATGESSNIWDDGYPSGGNYWSDYDGTDLYSGPYQNEIGSDGIGDTPYTRAGGANIDNYPLMNPLILTDIPIPDIDLIEQYFPILNFDDQEQFYLADFYYDDNDITNNSANYDESWPYYMYVHTVESEDYLCIQYWSYYCRDDKLWGLDIPLIGAHDHDWESIYVYLEKQDGNYIPAFITYFRHMMFEDLKPVEFFATYEWNSETIKKIDTHPVVYVARDSHASYEKTTYGYGIFVTPLTPDLPIIAIEPCEDGLELDYNDFQIIYVDEPDSWPERYGTIDAPWVRERWDWSEPVFPSPIVKFSMVSLNEPGSKLYLHTYDNQSRHVGFNRATSGIETEIPGSYYEDKGNTTFIILPENMTDFEVTVDGKDAHEYGVETYELLISAVRDGEVVDEPITGYIVKDEVQKYIVSVEDDSISITRPPDFLIGTDALQKTLSQGESSNFTITILSVYGFDSKVSLTTGPTPIECVFDPDEVTATPNSFVNSTLTVTVGSAIDPGDYTLTIIGTSDSLIHTASLTITVTQAPDQSEDNTLLLVLIGAAIVITAVILAWRKRKPG